MNEETVHNDAVHAEETEPVHRTDEERKEYRRKWMQKKREEERLEREATKIHSGGLDASEMPVVEVSTPAVVPIPMTRTDAKFEEKSPGYWIYGSEVKERECWQCSEKFETRLELNKFCGPKCKEEWLSDAFGKLKGASK
jgi:hypothetical protein